MIYAWERGPARYIPRNSAEMKSRTLISLCQARLFCVCWPGTSATALGTVLEVGESRVPALSQLVNGSDPL